ncbi:putative secreted protein [Wickerhamomyces ciferrii]|uniref:Secreted protein n=1 Tax=Wickerhamomyces ciferrii (strain ATCC 14091 / BCRC 22168 / CBS 111 / JCM 3599 / NBRC 0793 / NRRL Y-1031 F-60-10) TaxID=1206466 RepID=K0KY87_WICCF|nr:uncharacterized protein BN7_6008 [Wickerhamomyces ciferrii]CCH46414.1 putative secreted protein [Wickerhamomyces ciferrii]
MQLFTLVSIATLAQSIVCAGLNPIGSALAADKYVHTANYKIKFNSKDLKHEGTLSIKAKINDDNKENSGFFIANRSNQSSTNLIPKKEIKFDQKSVDAVFGYRSNDDNDVIFEIEGYSNPQKNVVGTSIDFTGIFQPKINDGASVGIPFEVSAILN